ncbi:MAG: SDR family NAD(P)-dependent oxidoreductase [Candidatus Melainabacteria bacterium]|nr:SDR family NAD(P)-dependent oxidoreductase [Candidatus Melainabacteria bacterium]
MASKRVLITGASGFVGANLTRRLLRDGHRVTVLLREQSDTWRIDDVLADLDVRSLDLLDLAAVRAVTGEIKADWIFHLAAYGNYSWQEDWRQIVDTNLTSTINLLEAASETGFDAFINTGSSSEYGICDHAPLESERVEPNSYYAVTKAAATAACRHVAAVRDLYIPTLRLYSVYGPYEDPRRLMPTIIRKGLEKDLPPLVDPDIARDFIYTDDVVEAYLAACKPASTERAPIYNVGSGVQTTIKEIVDLAREIFCIEKTPVWGSMDNRKWDASVWVASIGKIEKELGWKPDTSLRDGLSRFTAWLESQEAMKEHYRSAATARA